MNPGPREHAAELLEALVSTPSPSGEETAAVDVLAEHLEVRGLDPVIDEAGNLRCTRGPDDPDASHIALLGHIDTVPGQPPVRWEQDTLWGRGAVDAKGPLTAHALALASLPDDLASRVTLIAAVGEETDSRGARHLIGTMDAPDALVIAEPTGLATVGLGYKGRVRACLTARTTPAHPGAPEPRAPEQLLDAIEDLTAWTGNPIRDPGIDETTLRLTSLGTDHSAGEDRASAHLDLRLPSEVPSLEELEAHLPHGVELQIEEAVPAVRADPRNPLATALRGALIEAGHEPRMSMKTGTSDWNHVGPAWGHPPAVAYGPGDPSLDHTPDERIAVDDVVEAADVLVAAIGRTVAGIEPTARS